MAALSVLLAAGPALGQLPAAEVRAGAPRPWDAAIDAGPYGVVSVYFGEMHTAIPIFGFTGRGPSMGITLYHNSSLIGIGQPFGPELSPGWSISYGGRVDATTYAPDVVVIEDDGTRNYFTGMGSYVYEAPPGVFDELDWDATSSVWILTRKNQVQRVFDAAGKLLRVVDPAGNAVEVTWEQGLALTRIASVTDAAGRRIDFQYTPGTDKLAAIHDPANAASTEYPRSARTWTLAYADEGWGLRIAEIRDPVYGASAPIVIGYDVDGRITGVTEPYEAVDRPGKTFGFGYKLVKTWIRVTAITDPAALGTQGRSLSYSFTDLQPSGTEVATSLTDRRGNTWVFASVTTGTPADMGALRSVTNPLLKKTEVERDSDYNVVRYYDALGKYWIYDYDGSGNLLSATDPLSYQTTYGYDSWNNLTQVTDANSNSWLYEYGSAVAPTLLTQVTEPADGQGNGPAVTELGYYNTNGVNGESLGGLAYVVDPNGVTTAFLYDEWGQQKWEVEGAVISAGGFRDGYGVIGAIYPRNVVNFSASDDGSNPRSSGTAGKQPGSIECDANGRPISSSCPLIEVDYCWPFPNPGCGGAREESDERSFYGFAWYPSGFPYPAGLASVGDSPKGYFDTDDIEYSPRGQVLRLDNTVLYHPQDPRSREHIHAYDALGRTTLETVSTDETSASAPLVRGKTHTFADTTGQYSINVEGRTITSQLDAAGRVDWITDGDAVVSYEYLANGLLGQVDFGNGTQEIYEYYDNARLHRINQVTGTVKKYLEYHYDPAGRITRIVETVSKSDFQEILDYTYDNRNRLIGEHRYGVNGTAVGGYEITYTYDNGGNRKSKLSLIDGKPGIRVTYHYDTDPDVDGPTRYGSLNNRLLYTVSRVSGPEDDTETTWYYYDTRGNVERIVAKRSDQPGIHGLLMEYDAQGKLWRVSGDRWDEDWHIFQNDDIGVWRAVRRVDTPMTWHEARALATSMGGTLGLVGDEPELEWYIRTFRPLDGQETAYWMDGFNDYSQIPDPPPPGQEGCDYNPWWCWSWATAVQGYTWWVPWLPADAPYYPGYINGGWLSGEPNDADGIEDHDEDHMLFVFNEGDDPNSNGLADANSNALHGALIMLRLEQSDDYPPGYERLWAREFRYDGPRQRYLVRTLDPATMQADRETDAWTDYVGDTPVVDYHYDVDFQGIHTFVGDAAYLPGAAETDLSPLSGDPPGAVITRYIHNDHLGSTWFKTTTGTPVEKVHRTVRTAFGETVEVSDIPDGQFGRYGYAGAWGYQEHDVETNGLGDGCTDSQANASSSDGFPFMHVGYRYYDPGSGRFLQRDPIGIRGGRNVYQYVKNAPTRNIDPTGLVEPGYGEYWLEWFGPVTDELKAEPNPGVSWERTRGVNLPLGPISVLEYLEVTVILYSFGMAGATVGEVCMLPFALFTEYEPGTLYRGIIDAHIHVLDHFFPPVERSDRTN